MHKKRVLWQSILAVTIGLALVLPTVVYSEGGSQRTSRNPYDINLASDEFFTQAERDLVERVRQRLREDRLLAPYAERLEIMADQGQVFVRGMVKNDQEKMKVTATMQQTEGVETVENQLRVSGSAAS